MTMDSRFELMNFEEDVNYHAPILLTHLVGATDAGEAGGLVVSQILSSLPVKRVATFDTDSLIDYRANRPAVTINNWHVEEIDVPQIALDLVHDDSGTPILVLHGPEPDAKWQLFADEVAEFAQDAGVEMVVSLTGMPAAVPHTRPTMVHLQSTDKELVAGQPKLTGGPIQFPSSANTFLHHLLSKQGIEGVTFLAAVPYYMANMEYPKASLALLERMTSVFDLSLPTGNIEANTQFVTEQLRNLAGENEEVIALVGQLEKHFDNEIDEAVKKIGSFPTPADFVFGSSESVEETDKLVDTDALARTIEQFLARTEDLDDPLLAEEDPSQPKPRHRAPRPWEIPDSNE
ncbi:MAG: PAC2 family protein [Actinomycetaceae bacterium]|nr:PAC2 family protein [Actinomycetaceae bacterium]